MDYFCRFFFLTTSGGRPRHSLLLHRTCTSKRLTKMQSVHSQNPGHLVGCITDPDCLPDFGLFFYKRGWEDGGGGQLGSRRASAARHRPSVDPFSPSAPPQSSGHRGHTEREFVVMVAGLDLFSAEASRRSSFGTKGRSNAD